MIFMLLRVSPLTDRVIGVEVGVGGGIMDNSAEIFFLVYSAGVFMVDWELSVKTHSVNSHDHSKRAAIATGILTHDKYDGSGDPTAH